MLNWATCFEKHTYAFFLWTFRNVWFFSPKLLKQLVWLTVRTMCWENSDSVVEVTMALCHRRILSSLGNPPMVRFRGRLASLKQCKAVWRVKEPGPIVTVKERCSRLTRCPFPFPLFKYALFPPNSHIFISELFPFEFVCLRRGLSWY